MTPSTRILSAVALVSALTLSGCAHQAPQTNSALPCAFPEDGTQSHDILCREPVSNRSSVKHILVSWKGVGAETRTYEEAQTLARDLLRQVRAGTAIEALMSEHSEDPGSAKSGIAYDVTTSASFVSTFKTLSLRLQVGEAGIVQSPFGLHVIKRVN